MHKKRELIDREILFGNPDKAAVRLSPDGTHISYLAAIDGVLNIWVGEKDQLEDAKPISFDKGRGIQSYRWAYTNEHILYIQDKNGDENWHLYVVDLKTNEVVDLTPMDGVQAQIHKVSHQFPEEIIIGINERTPQLHDLYRLNIVTGERLLLLENKGFTSFVTDEQYQVRIGERMLGDGSVELMELVGEDEWRLWTSVPMEDTLTTRPISFNLNGRLYGIDSRNRNTAALIEVDFATGEEKHLFGSDLADVSGILTDPKEKSIQAVSYDFERKKWHILDEAIREDWENLESQVDGDIEVVSRCREDNLWIVAYILDDGGIHYYLYEREPKRLIFLFANREVLARLPLVKMHPITLHTRDGMQMVSYISFPPETEFLEDFRPVEPLPMILLVHGGPWARDQWGYNPMHQWLANRGYVVLSVNFRGSTGFGKKFLNAGNLEWGRKMHYDLIDAVDWAISWKIADPNRIGIMGGSYGGYATLAGLTFTPQKFACGVDIVGPSNLITLLESLPPYWQPMVEMFAQRVGDHRTVEGRQLLLDASPLNSVARIERPLLIGQGANDPRVKQAESDQIVAEMEENDIPVTYILYPDEGHGFVRPENRFSFFGVTELFLAKYLGGRVQLLSESDLQGSSMQVLAGAQHTPGLPG